MIESNLWHSWDPHPWKHPWLTGKNLMRMKNFSREVLTEEREKTKGLPTKNMRFAFCCNMANSNYSRAKPLRKRGLKIDLHLHPQDSNFMSHPGWEDYLRTIDGDAEKVFQEKPLIFPPDVYQEKWSGIFKLSDTPISERHFLRYRDILEFEQWMGAPKTLKALNEADAVLVTQHTYFGYLSRARYLVTQTGGDIWFEASRNDELGQLQRLGFSRARMFLTSNPWSYAHARRFGFNNLVYLPLILDDDEYSPGRGESRKSWQESIGGEFFVLSTSRFDHAYKGSQIGLKGFSDFSKKFPECRLVLIRWGENQDELDILVREYGLEGKVLFLPLSGKALLRDYLRSADAMLDQFVLGYFGATGLEAMASGLPLIGRIERNQYDAVCETGAPPILNASDSDQVTLHLSRLFTDGSFRRDLSKKVRDWFLANHGSTRWGPDYEAVLAATAKSIPIDFSESPLKEELSEEEKEYHRLGKEKAPKTLTYSI